MSRCNCCGTILSDMELLSKRKVEDFYTGEIREVFDDLCYSCRIESCNIYSYSTREYQFEGVTTGVSSKAGFSDNY